MLIIPTLGKQRQEDQKLWASLGYKASSSTTELQNETLSQKKSRVGDVAQW
jgi:hypothetical protein